MISFMLSYMRSYISFYHFYYSHYGLNEQGVIVYRLEYKNTYTCFYTFFFNSASVFLNFSSVECQMLLRCYLIYISICVYIENKVYLHFNMLITNKINVVKVKITKTPIIIFT